MKDKIANTIVLKQMIINELLEIRKAIIESIDDDAKLTITTRHRIGFIEMHTFKRKHTMDISVPTMTSLLDEMIQKEKDYIDKLIDAEVERKLKNEGNLQIK